MRDDLVHNDSFVMFRLSMSFRGSGIDVLLVKNEFTRIVFRLIERVGNIALLPYKGFIRTFFLDKTSPQDAREFMRKSHCTCQRPDMALIIA